MKKTKKIPLLSWLGRSGLSKDDFESIIPAINDKNYHMLFFSAALASILLGILSIVAYSLPQLEIPYLLYQLTSIAFLLITLAAWFIVRTRRSLSLLFLYIMAAVAYTFCIVIGTVLQPELPATSFIVILFAFPLFIIDKPFRFVILNILATAAFCVSSYLVKASNIFTLDIVNALSFMLFGIILNTYFMRTKLRDLLNQNYIEHERDTDALTSLLNYSAGVREIKAYLRSSNDAGALMIFDVDNFKYYNDHFGHACGDSILSMIGDGMRSAFRSSDTLTRMGGDEFIVFLPKMLSREQIDFCLGRLISKLQSDPRNAVHPITISIGVALYPSDSVDYDELFAMADKALYGSKGKGKNCSTYYADL